jgi:hypothetical protein
VTSTATPIARLAPPSSAAAASAPLVEVGDDDFGALPRKQRRDPLADAARRAGDNRYLIFKLHPVLQFSPPFCGENAAVYFARGNSPPGSVAYTKKLAAPW